MPKARSNAPRMSWHDPSGLGHTLYIRARGGFGGLGSGAWVPACRL
jgi:hypothetical protein